MGETRQNNKYKINKICGGNIMIWSFLMKRENLGGINNCGVV